MQRAAFEELDAHTRDSLLHTVASFLRELRDICGQPQTTSSARYALSFGVKKRSVMRLSKFARRYANRQVAVRIFGPSHTGVRELSRECNYEYFARLEIVVPLAVALLSPELGAGARL